MAYNALSASHCQIEFRSGQRSFAHRRCAVDLQCLASSVRKPKCSDIYEDYDAIREALHRQGHTKGFIAGALNFLGGNAFGNMRDNARTGGRLYRHVLDSKWASKLRSGVAGRPGATCFQEAADEAAEHSAPGSSPSSVGSSIGAASRVSSRSLQLLLNCEETALKAMARRWPPLLELDIQELQHRLVALKAVLPDVDVAEVVRSHPRGFLSADLPDLTRTIATNVSSLQAGLHGADVNAIVQQDPLLVLQNPAMLEDGIGQLKQLWDIDAAALAESDPWKLALAVRAMTKSALPRTF